MSRHTAPGARAETLEQRCAGGGSVCVDGPLLAMQGKLPSTPVLLLLSYSTLSLLVRTQQPRRFRSRAWISLLEMKLHCTAGRSVPWCAKHAPGLWMRQATPYAARRAKQQDTPMPLNGVQTERDWLASELNVGDAKRSVGLNDVGVKAKQQPHNARSLYHVPL